MRLLANDVSVGVLCKTEFMCLGSGAYLHLVVI
jgi:hypothetical protein